MNATPQKSHRFRSVLAVFAGLITVVVTSTATDAVMHGTGIFPPPGMAMSTTLWMLATAYRTLYGVLGGYVTARIAPGQPISHALALGWIGAALSLAGTIGTWNMGPEFGPKWYPISLIVLSVPSAWAGGSLVRPGTNARGSAR